MLHIAGILGANKRYHLFVIELFSVLTVTLYDVLVSFTLHTLK